MFDAAVQEWLNLVLRWIHVLAGIAWIGDSLFFMWLDGQMQPLREPQEGVTGETWLLHGGSYFQVDRRLLRPGELPPKLHWFWQQTTLTLLSGLLLLIVVYYLNAAMYMVDPAVRSMSGGAAVALSVGFFVTSWFAYDLLWRSPVGRRVVPAAMISFAMLMALSYGLTHVFSPRAAFLQLGAIMGAIMTTNVWVHILPPQRKMLEAAQEGRVPDYTLGVHAKTRSTHNTYMTFPVIVFMISNHFPGMYTGPLNWVMAGLLILAGAGVRQLMIVGLQRGRLVLGGTSASVAVMLALTFQPWAAQAPPADASVAPFGKVRQVIATRCCGCHSETPTEPGFRAAPQGLALDTPQQIQRYAAKIKERAVTRKDMPFANATGITEEERQLLGRWVDAGARLR